MNATMLLNNVAPKGTAQKPASTAGRGNPAPGTSADLFAALLQLAAVGPAQNAVATGIQPAVGDSAQTSLLPGANAAPSPVGPNQGQQVGVAAGEQAPIQTPQATDGKASSPTGAAPVAAQGVSELPSAVGDKARATDIRAPQPPGAKADSQPAAAQAGTPAAGTASTAVVAATKQASVGPDPQVEAVDAKADAGGSQSSRSAQAASPNGMEPAAKAAGQSAGAGEQGSAAGFGDQNPRQATALSQPGAATSQATASGGAGFAQAIGQAVQAPNQNQNQSQSQAQAQGVKPQAEGEKPQTKSPRPATGHGVDGGKSGGIVTTAVSLQNQGTAAAGPVIKPETVQSQPQAAQPRDVLNQVLSRVKVQVSPERTEARIHLVPESLGPVDLKVTLEGGQLTARFHVANGQVKDILEQHLPELRQTLHDQGIRVEQFSVTMDSGALAQGSGQERQQQAWQFRQMRQGHYPTGLYGEEPVSRLQGATSRPASLNQLDLIA